MFPQTPKKKGSHVEWNVSRGTSSAISGQDSVELHIDGRQGDGTIWIENGFSVRKNSQTQFMVFFDFYSENESYNVIGAVVGFVGTYNLEVEAGFIVIGKCARVSGWKSYRHTATLNTGSGGEVWVAVGISVRWETEMVYNLDDVKVAISRKT